jgi:hypothetical protein
VTRAYYVQNVVGSMQYAPVNHSTNHLRRKMEKVKFYLTKQGSRYVISTEDGRVSSTHPSAIAATDWFDRTKRLRAEHKVLIDKTNG